MRNLCGNCRICCIILKIDKEFLPWRDTDKEAGVACDKLKKNGCGVYFKRPSPCKKYECFWLQLLKQKIKKPEWKPNKIGFIVNAQDRNNTYILTIKELEKDSLDFNNLTMEQDKFLKYMFSLTGKIDKEYTVMIHPFGHSKKYPLKFTSKT
jgi:uncharacterized cysteine cluster protein YcgN (CxxCxxCC family)